MEQEIETAVLTQIIDPTSLCTRCRSAFSVAVVARLALRTHEKPVCGTGYKLRLNLFLELSTPTSRLATKDKSRSVNQREKPTTTIIQSGEAPF